MTKWLISQLKYLEYRSKEDITMIIYGPGGSVHAGMALYDTMQYLSCEVRTVCVGIAASMHAFILAAGKKGKRFALKHSEIMIHQPIGGTYGSASTISLEAAHIMGLNRKLAQILADETGKKLNTIMRDMDRDTWMDPIVAKNYGIIDNIGYPDLGEGFFDE